MSSHGAGYTGVSTDGIGGGTVQPITVEEEYLRASALAHNTESIDPLTDMSEEQVDVLTSYLTSRLNAGTLARNRRAIRYGKIDKSISTWRQLNKEDSERLRKEESDGKSRPVPFNLPMLASHLADMSSYFTEALAPVSNPFFSASGQATEATLLKKMNQDALRRNYYGELNLTVRALLKYNTGGFTVEWDRDDGHLNPQLAEPGNRWKSACMYNTIWDPAIRDVTDVPTKAEYAATFEMTNRLSIMRRALKGRLVRVEELLENEQPQGQKKAYYKEPPVSAGLNDSGEDDKTSGNSNEVQWSNYGLGVVTDLGPEADGFEETTMYCWLMPARFGLLTKAEIDALAEANMTPHTFLELWKFTIIGTDLLAAASPVVSREDFINGEKAEIPLYLAHLTQDQMKEAQRSAMELMRGFQRYGSAMFDIYLNGMRSNVWGKKAYDPAMFNMTPEEAADPVGALRSKKSGVDVRAGIQDISTKSGVEGALTAVTQTMDLKNSMFPTQQLPSQVASIDRAVKSQVTTVIQGAQRSLRVLLRTLDSSLMLPIRLAAFRNMKLYDGDGLEDLTSEAVAKMIGSGIESMEAERVAEALWQLLYAIVQNQESLQVFDVPKLLTYIGRVANLSVDLGSFYRQQAQPTQVPQPTPGGMPAG